MLLCLTASHKTAPFELLERLSVHTTAIGPLIAANAECVQGAAVLATCNRFEAYIEMDEPVTAAEVVGVEAALGAIETATGVAAGELHGSFEVKTCDAVAEHLFSVASGLESVVVGEGEIAGQVRRALTDAREHGTASTELERLFQRATEAQKGVKNATALGRAGRSLVRLALDLADSRIADWTSLRVLLVGTGSYAAATLAALRDHGVTDLAVHSPSGRTAAFAAKHGIRAAGRDQLAHEAAASDMIITCTSAERPVVDAALLREGGLEERRMFVIDLGLPRNVDADVATFPSVTLLDLETIRLHAPLEELQATDAARAIVQDAAARFHLVGREQGAARTVVALRAHVFELLEAEVARARGRGDDALIEPALRHLVGVLLHTPTARAREFAAQGRGDEFAEALETLFGITAEPAETRHDEEDDDAATA